MLGGRWERKFAYDSYANRVGKGSHKAVDRVCQFVREQESGVGHGYVLKLDTSTCFPSIRRDVLRNLLKPGLADMPRWAQRIVHELPTRPHAYPAVPSISTTTQHSP